MATCTDRNDLSKVPPRLLLIGGNNNFGLNSQSWLLDSSPKLSEFCRIPKQHRYKFSSFCKTPEGFAVTGGEGSDDAVMYVAESNKWKQLTRLLEQRCCHGSIFLKNLVFVFGGWVNPRYSGSVQYLDESGSWQVAPAIPQGVRFPEVVKTDDDGVFLLDPWYRNELFRMDFETKLWVRKAALTGGLSEGARMTCVNGKLCVAGGVKNILAWYTPSTDTWAHGVKLQLRHYFGAVMHQNNTILVVGGEDQKKVESYDLDTGVWSVCNWEMPERLINLHGLMID